jgi:DNA modification methylase
MNAVLESGLKFWWLLCIHHNGQHTQMFQRKIFVRWKPLLWFVKGTKISEHVKSFSDFIESTPTNKIYHKWQQSTTEAEYIINHLTLKNQTIFDAFLGSGSSALASLKLGRKFIGIEKDPQVFKIAKQRVTSFHHSSSVKRS